MPTQRVLICGRRTGRTPRWPGAALLAGILLVAGTSHADDTSARLFKRKVLLTCAAEIDQYCGELPDSRSTGRNAAICLKPYRYSLSLPCRRVVRAVFP